MPRLMSVALTEQAVIERRKTVTRRWRSWQSLKPGDRLTLVRKSMGRKRADGTVEPLVRLAEVEVVDVTQEPLNWVTDDEAAREGFPDWTGADFEAFFVKHMGCAPNAIVTRIEWVYLNGGAA